MRLTGHPITWLNSNIRSIFSAQPSFAAHQHFDHIPGSTGTALTSAGQLWTMWKPFDAGDTVPLQSFVDFATGSNVVLHESVGPVFNFSGTDVQSQNIYLNHTTQAQVGSIFNALNVRVSRLLACYTFWPPALRLANCQTSCMSWQFVTLCACMESKASTRTQAISSWSGHSKGTLLKGSCACSA